MLAVRYVRFGEPDVVTVSEVDEPHAAAGEIRIDVRAAAVNPLDWKRVGGAMARSDRPDGPTGVGVDAAGVVDEVGAGVTGVAVGDAVFGQGRDTYAQKAVLTSWAPKPTNVSYEEAAGYGVAAETAHRVLSVAAVQPGETILVSGASGGVGTALVQLAVARGVTVIGTASPDNQSYLTSLGATSTTYGDGLADRVAALAPDGVDAAFDLAGSGVLPELIAIVGDPSRVVTIADFNAADTGAVLTTGGDQHAAAFAEASALAAGGQFSIPVTGRYAMADAAKALVESRQGHTRGKLVVLPTTTG